jgi:hypothetical protein
MALVIKAATLHGVNLQANIETAFYHKCLQNTSIMAAHLGLTEDAKKYQDWATRILEVYNKHLLVTRDVVLQVTVPVGTEARVNLHKAFSSSIEVLRSSKKINLVIHGEGL